MRPFRLPIVAAALALSLMLVLAGPAAGQILHVPGDYSTLQGAIDNATPGTRIVVAGGTHRPITIDRALTIVGAPQATIDNTDAFDPDNPFHLRPSILLRGSGTGTVTLANIKTQGVADGSIFASSGEGIRGGGFGQLHVLDSNIAPAQWTMLTGTGEGDPAIRTSVAYVLISNSTVTGGLSDTDECNHPIAPDGAAAILAPTSTVTVLDSAVKGGRGPQMCFTAGNCPPGPCPCAGILAKGGPGIQAATVLRAGSSVLGGDGQPVDCAGSSMGTQPNGVPIVAGTVVNLTNGLTCSGPMIMGTVWSLQWITPGPTALLLTGSPSLQPVTAGNTGWLFLNGGTMLASGVAAGGVKTLVTTLPTTASLVGVEVGIQIYDTTIGLTRPVIEMLRP